MLFFFFFYLRVVAVLISVPLTLELVMGENFELLHGTQDKCNIQVTSQSRSPQVPIDRPSRKTQQSRLRRLLRP